MDAEPTVVKIKSYKVGQRGHRGRVLTLPRAWVEDANLQPGDRIDVFRDTQNRLIIQKAEKASA